MMPSFSAAAGDRSIMAATRRFLPYGPRSTITTRLDRLGPPEGGQIVGKRRQFVGNEEMAFAHEQKRNAHEQIAFPDEQKRNAREQIAFPDCGRGAKELPVVSGILCKRSIPGFTVTVIRPLVGRSHGAAAFIAVECCWSS